MFIRFMRNNKYKQTHYNHENPLPKTVQGYKFNIFYHDLGDKLKTPIYSIEKNDDSTESEYEDLTCQIVDRE